MVAGRLFWLLGTGSGSPGCGQHTEGLMAPGDGRGEEILDLRCVWGEGAWVAGGSRRAPPLSQNEGMGWLPPDSSAALCVRSKQRGRLCQQLAWKGRYGWWLSGGVPKKIF